VPLESFYFTATVEYKDVPSSAANSSSSSSPLYQIGLSGTGGHGEYDIRQCAVGTPSIECVHRHEYVTVVNEDAGRFSYANGTLFPSVALHRADPHVHAGAISIVLQDGRTNETLCEVTRANGGLRYERSFIVHQRACTWSVDSAPVLEYGTPLRAIATYDASEHQMGAMATWYLYITPPP
jgi:hypothetical protein